MSKPKHYKRGMGYYVGYGYKSTDLDAIKGVLTYHQNIHIEIRALERRGDTRNLAKLRRYLARAM